MVVKDERKRYFLIKFFNSKPNSAEINKELRSTISKLAGELFLAKSGISILDAKLGLVVKTNHESRDVVEAAISLLELENNLCKVVQVTGTLKTIKDCLL